MKTIRVLGVNLVALATAIALVGCASDQHQRRTAAELYQEAQEEANPDGALGRAFRDCKIVANKFQKVIRSHPGSDYALLALIGIGDCHFEEERYAEATSAYRRFADRYPTHRDYPKALYRLAEAYYRQHDDYDRDLNKIRNAATYYSLFLQHFPDHVRAEAAAERYQEIAQTLAQHELYVAKQYLRDDHYASAYQRLRRLARTYRGTPQANTAEELMTQLQEQLGLTDEELARMD